LGTSFRINGRQLNLAAFFIAGVKGRCPENLTLRLSSFKIPVAKPIYLRYFNLTPVLPTKGGNMETTRLSNKGQIVIPKQVRVTHGWEPGLEFIVEDTGDGIKLKPVTPYLETKAEELLGCVGYEGPKRSLKEMEAAIAEGVRKKI
jgi:AbrB family looped-hinge helix DNA binding protein